VIPYGRQSIDESDIEAVVRVLKGDWLTQGPHVEEFEEALADRVGARHAIAVCNGTAALHAACVAAGLGPGSVGMTSALTFAASANCLLYVGADVGLVDIDPLTLNLDPTQVSKGIDALVAVHYAGLPLDLGRLPYRPSIVIEDASHALGAQTPDGPVGNCSRSDMCVFSFHPVKHITTGEGGAVTTNSDELAGRLRRLRHHGIVPHPDRGGWYYDIEMLGFNYRMTDLEAALGTSQLTKLDRFLSRRSELADRYRERLAHLPITLPPQAPTGWLHAYHLFPVRVPNRSKVYDALRAAGVGVQVHYVPIHHHPLYRGRCEAWLPETDAAYDELLSLPLFADLTDGEQDLVIGALEAVL
jgi:UDP-4-amino-4,6-dideoxy-N-acetyl-beta-L-altrosamine transaminase